MTSWKEILLKTIEKAAFESYLSKFADLRIHLDFRLAIKQFLYKQGIAGKQFRNNVPVQIGCIPFANDMQTYQKTEHNIIKRDCV